MKLYKIKWKLLSEKKRKTKKMRLKWIEYVKKRGMGSPIKRFESLT